MKAGFIQTSPIFGEKEKNFDQVRSLVGDAKTDLLVLPELFATGYAYRSKEEAEKMAEDIHGPTANFLCELSKKTEGVIVGGFVEKAEGKIFNSSLIVYEGKVIDTYRKIHLFNKEKLWFSPGDKPFRVYEINNFKLGVMICFDWIFPEVARTMALKGAQIIAHPSNLVMPWCQHAMITRCIENRLFAVTANRIGTEQRNEDIFTFTGGSQIVSYDGSVMCAAADDKVALSIVDVDIQKANNKTINQFNDVIGDRREEFYK
ncbi:MAG: nitrilase-related carbon-nitrogen hydrolase [Bacteroidota bacterium]